MRRIKNRRVITDDRFVLVVRDNDTGKIYTQRKRVSKRMTLRECDYHTIKSHLLLVAHMVSPNMMVQNKFVETVHQMEKDGLSQSSILRQLTGLILDMMNHGTWPG